MASSSSGATSMTSSSSGHAGGDPTMASSSSGGAGGAPTMETSSSSGGAGGDPMMGSSSSGTAGSCSTAADCPGLDTLCAVRTCTGGLCGTSFIPVGTPAAPQTNGDCQKMVCDG